MANLTRLTGQTQKITHNNIKHFSTIMKAIQKRMGIKQGNRTGSAVSFFRNRGFLGSRSQLISWAGINTTQSAVTFSILQTQPNNAATVYGMERRLNIADAFVALSIGVYLGRSATTTTANPTNAQAASTRLLTYPNPGVFTAANEATNLEAVYNSSLNVKIGQVNWFPNISVRKFYRVGQAQQVAAGTNQNGIGRDEWSGPDYGLMPLIPTFTINGNGNNEFTVNFPDSVNTAAASGSFNSLLLVMDGVLLPNAAGRIDLETANAFATQYGG